MESPHSQTFDTRAEFAGGGWTPERMTRFLDHLAERGNVRAACARVGLSREAAYRLRRRDPLFARGWAAALVRAREHVEQVIGDLALEGIEEEVWYRGELRGTRRRFDARLLLAHMGRLDRLAGDALAADDAARFDEMLACIAGERAPDGITSNEDVLPVERETAAEHFAELAERAARRAEADEDEDFEAYEDRCDAARLAGEAEGAACWDGWFAQACGAVDRVATGDTEFAPGTVSGVSTAALAVGLAGGAARPQSGSAKT